MLIFQHFPSNNILVSVHSFVPSLKNTFQQLIVVWFAYLFRFHIAYFFKLQNTHQFPRCHILFTFLHLFTSTKLTNSYKFKIEKCIHIFPIHLFKFFSVVSTNRLLTGHRAGNTVIEHIQFLTVLFITYSIFI